jgi:hypothetical protein
MTDATGADALLNFWKTQVEEATKAWTRAVSQTQAVDPAQFWRPVMDPAINAWAEVLARGPVSPDVLGQWKQFLDQWIDAWGQALERAMQTDAFAQALGRYLDQWVAGQAPVRKAASEMSEITAAALGVASRSDVAAMQRQLTDLEDRIDELHDQMRALLTRSGAARTRPRSQTRRLARTPRRPGKRRGAQS